MTELERLRALLTAEQVKLGVHIRRMNSPGSPVYRAGENIIPAGLILFGSFGATVAVHWWLGAALLASGSWWWLARVLPKVKDGVFERTAELVLTSEAAFDQWWARGVLSLYAKLPDGTELAATRREDWREFVRRIPDDLAALGAGRMMVEQ